MVSQVGKMKYFFKWLLNDIKTSWAKNAEAYARIWGHFLDMAKFLIGMFSAMLLFAVVVSVIILKSKGDSVNGYAVMQVLVGLAILNGSIFLADKLRKYRSEKDQLVQILKD
jgi:hypothetical protein